VENQKPCSRGKLIGGYGLKEISKVRCTFMGKGNGMVIVNELDYLNKMKQLIFVETRFKKLTQNPTKSGEDSLTAHLRKLKKKMK